jgi:hypothetical protein
MNGGKINKIAVEGKSRSESPKKIKKEKTNEVMVKEKTSFSVTFKSERKM